MLSTIALKQLADDREFYDRPPTPFDYNPVIYSAFNAKSNVMLNTKLNAVINADFMMT
ncbi:hypothetical protein ACN4EG_08875 [Alkalinema pantanalense CENA528]|uniref:hypothetical protein n=1 Tax=Alkalinema pantanalense TaxID=1620705 RepID=UPI003D6F91BD